MKFDILRTLVLAVVVLAAGCGNLTEPSAFSFATLTGVPPNTSVQSNVVTIKGNQFGAPISFANTSSAAYSQISINGGGFTGAAGQLLSPGNTLQLQQTTASTANTARTTTITVGGFTTTFTTVTSTTGGIVSAGPDANGNSVTISSVAGTLNAGSNGGGVTFLITANTNFSTTSTNGISGNTIPVAFTLQAISNSGQVVYFTTATNVPIPFGQQSGVALVSGTLPTTVSGNLPNAVTVGGVTFHITDPQYWSSLISFWQIAPGTLTLLQ